MKPRKPANPQQPPANSQAAILHLCLEYLCRFMVVATACSVVFLSVVAWLAQGFLGKKFIEVHDLVVVAGLGFGTIILYYFKKR